MINLFTTILNYLSTECFFFIFLKVILIYLIYDWFSDKLYFLEVVN